jgi:hypothetical protein
MISYMALVFLAIILPVWYFLPSQIAAQQVRRIAEGRWAPNPRAGVPSNAFPTDTDKLLSVFQTTSIIGWAQLEGVAFMGCIAYQIEAQPFTLAVVAVALLLMVATFPTQGRVSAWLEQHEGRVNEWRQFRRVRPPGDLGGH